MCAALARMDEALRIVTDALSALPTARTHIPDSSQDGDKPIDHATHPWIIGLLANKERFGGNNPVTRFQGARRLCSLISAHIDEEIALDNMQQTPARLSTALCARTQPPALSLALPSPSAVYRTVHAPQADGTRMPESNQHALLLAELRSLMQ